MKRNNENYPNIIIHLGHAVIHVLLFLQVNDQLVEIPDFAPNIKGVLWEMWALDKVKTVRQLFKALQICHFMRKPVMQYGTRKVHPCSVSAFVVKYQLVLWLNMRICI